jgi:hypothetical protein
MLAVPGSAAATVPARLGHAALTGAGYGALAGAGEGEGLKGAAIGAGEGAVTGAALGTLGAGAMEALRPVGQRVMAAARGIYDPDAEAARRVAQHVVSDWQRTGPALTAEEIAAANAAGTPRALIDTAGESTRALGRSAANSSPAARDALTTMTQERFEQQAPRIAGFVRQMTGGGDTVADLEAIQAAARRANRPAYAQAYRDGAIPLWDDGFRDLTAAPVVRQAMRQAVATGANKAAAEGFRPPNPPFRFNEDGTFEPVPGVHPTLQYWDSVKRNLDDRVNALARSGEREAANDARALRSLLVQRLDDAVPSYASARRGAAAFFGAENALEAGQNFMRSTASIPEAQRALARMSAPERALFARGYAADLADAIARSGDNRNVLNSVFLNNPAGRKHR